jgi:hypothetical protein
MKTEFTRNEITKALTRMQFGKKSEKNAGKDFFAPVLAVPTLGTATINGVETKILYGIEDWLWQGIEDITNAVNGVNRRTFMDIHLDCINDETGEFDENKWETEAGDFTAAPERLSEVEDQVESLQDKQTAIINSDTFGSDPEQINMVKAIAAQLKPLKEKAAAISARYAIRVTQRRLKKQAEEAKAANS